MNPASILFACGRWLACAGLSAALVPFAGAQAAAPGNSSVPAAKPSGETIQLNVFEVLADKDDSYGALNSNSITRFNTELAKLPISADIYNEAFMRDVNAQTVEQMIADFTAGAGFASSDGPASTLTAQPGDRAANSYVQLRGLTAPGMLRDGFLTLAAFANTGGTATGVTNNFDLERAEVIMGPQALLYGNGGGGGVINLVSKQARFRKRPFGSFRFQLDQYGSMTGNYDFGWGGDKLAVRAAFINQDTKTRRVNIGNKLDAQYVQFGWRPFHNTVVRLVAEQSSNNRNWGSNLSVTALNAANDARNGQSLHYLLATGQINGSASGPSGGGAIAGGAINWGNVDSFFGWRLSERTVDTLGTLTVETEWTRGVTTQFSIGYKDFYNRLFNASTSALLAPNAAANSLGVWAVGGTGGQPAQESIQPTETFPARFSVAFENQLFGGRAHSQSILGADYTRLNEAFIGYGYYQADANWNPIVNAAIAANNGRTVIGPVLWPMGTAPMAYPAWQPGQPRVTWQGVNYVRMHQNPVNPAAVSAENPLGVTLGGGNYNLVRIVNKGVYGINETTWLGGKLETLLGFRASHTFAETRNQGSALSAQNTESGARKTSDEKTISYSVGANYALRDWLRPYVAVSDSYNPPIAQNNDPLGEQPKAAHAVGGEVGVKVQNASGTVSGSLALYHTSSKNETFFVTSTLAFAINPSGLNGRFGGSPSTIINVDRKVSGAQLAVTATPTRNLRVRVSAATISGEIGSTRLYRQVYNDQFHANAAGQVTYRDGAPVYVNPTFSSARPTVPAGTAGAVPLTIAMMSSPASSYYANPLAVSGQINRSSNAARVLAVSDPVHGPILTGATGLPISQMQIDPGFSVPGTIPVTNAGESTTNYPALSWNCTTVYTFSDGPVRGLRVGGTLATAWYNRRYYYYPNGVSIGSERRLFGFPTQTRFDLLLGYDWKVGRYSLGTQLNVSNLFNRYQVVLTPNAINGWSGPNNATFDAQPRLWTWSMTLGF